MIRGLRLCLLTLAMLVSAEGCQEKAAKVVMPENPSPLPDRSQRFELGDGATASEAESGLSQ